MMRVRRILTPPQPSTRHWLALGAVALLLAGSGLFVVQQQREELARQAQEVQARQQAETERAAADRKWIEEEKARLAQERAALDAERKKAAAEAQAQRKAAAERKRQEQARVAAEAQQRREADARAAEELRRQEAEAREAAERARRPAPGTIRRRGTDNAEMAFIPAGTFTMGDTHGDGRSDEQPARSVSVAAFWLDKTEVTNAQFAQFIQAGHTARGDWRQYAKGKDQHPVVNVTWHDAVAYCQWARKRLPSEAEWEYAARGSDGRKYPWGNQWDGNRARWAGNRQRPNIVPRPPLSTPVGSYPSGASPFGILDMAGNVWEWTSSLYMPYPYRAEDGREDLNASGERVKRGGSWVMSPTFLRSASRIGFRPSDQKIYLGFRCAQDAEK